MFGECKVILSIDDIKSKTVAKLTCDEAQTFGLANIGFGFYKGDLKTRYNGIKREQKCDNVFWFDSTRLRVEFIRLADELEPMWAARCYDKEREQYVTFPMGTYGCNFIRG